MPTKKKITASKDFKEMTIAEFSAMYCRNEETKKLWLQILNHINTDATPVAKIGSLTSRHLKDGTKGSQRKDNIERNRKLKLA